MQGLLDGRAMLTRGKDTRTFSIVGAPTIPADLTCFDESFQPLADSASPLRRIFPNVQLVEVDVLGIQAPQTVFTILAEVLYDNVIIFGDEFTFFIHDKPELGSDHGLIPPACQRLRQNPLAVPRPVIGCRVEKIDSHIQPGVDGAQRFVIVHLAPPGRIGFLSLVIEHPRSTNCPAAQPHGADFNSAFPKYSGKHDSTPVPFRNC